MWCVSLIILLSLWYDKQQTRWNVVSFLPLIGILCIAFFLRTYTLTTLPSFVHGDEAWIGIEAKNILSPSYTGNIFQTGWYEYPQLTFLLAAIPMKILGISLFSLRISSVILGLLSIAVCYIMVQTFRNTKEAIIASILLSCSHLHIHFSRIGTHYMQGLLFIEVAIFFFLLAIKQKRVFFMLLAGVITGLGFHVYLSARITAVIIGMTLLVFFIFRQKKIVSWQQLGVFCVGILFGIGPHIVSLFPTNSRTSQVFLINNLHHLTSVYGTNQWHVIVLQQVLQTLSFLIGGIDKSVQYGIQNPGIDIITFILCFIGIFLWMYSTKRKDTKEKAVDYSLLFFSCMSIWLAGILCIGGMITIDAPFYPRLLPCIVPICILSAYALCTITTGKSRTLQYLFLTSIVGYICITNIYTYFFVYKRLDTYRDTAQYTAIGRVAQYYQDKNIFLVQDGSLSPNYATIHFLAPSAHIFDTNTIAKALTQATSSAVILVASMGEYTSVTQLQNNYPSYIWETLSTNTNRPLLYYTIIP